MKLSHHDGLVNHRQHFLENKFDLLKKIKGNGKQNKTKKPDLENEKRKLQTDCSGKISKNYYVLSWVLKREGGIRV